jgi:hypothetical protein
MKSVYSAVRTGSLNKAVCADEMTAIATLSSLYIKGSSFKGSFNIQTAYCGIGSPKYAV